MSDLVQDILSRRPAMSYGEIARAVGISRGAVSGLIYRAAHPTLPRPPHARQERVFRLDGPILQLMADGRERSTPEIAARIEAPRWHVWRRMKVLRDAGVMAQVSAGNGGLPSTWVEVDE